jgi:PAS domain S-box-containing protein
MVPSHLWRLAPDGEPIFFNKRMVDFLGLNVIGTDKPGMSRLEAVITTVIHPDDVTEFRNTLARCLVTGESFELRYRLRRVDGVYRWMSSRAEPMRDEAGRIVQWYGLCHDVDDQIHAEEALRRSEQQWRQLVDTVPASIWCTTRDGAPVYRNMQHSGVTGAAIEDAKNPGGYSSPLAAMAHPDDRVAAEQVRARAYATGSTYLVRYRQIRSDGTYRWTESRAEPLRDESGEILQWYGVSIDIHDLVTAQEALQRSERELSQLVNMLPVHIRRLSPEGETIFFNKRLVDFVGLDLAALNKRGMSGLEGTVQTLIHPDDAANLQETINHSLATGESYATKYRVRRADGVYRWMEGRGEPLRDQNGAIVQWYGISIDIDDEVRAQEALRESENSLRELIETAPARIWCFSPDGEPTYWSRQLREFFGFDVDDRDEPGRPRLSTLLKATTHPDEADKVISLVKQNLVTGEPWMIRRRQQHRDGEYRWVETHASAMRNADGAIVLWTAVNFDIHDLVVAQEALQRSESRLRQLIDVLPAMIWSTSPEGTPTYVNKRFTDVIGATVEDITAPDGSPSLISIIHREDVSAAAVSVSRSFKTGAPYIMQYRQIRRDGSYRWTETRAEPLRNESGEILQWYGLSVDIHDLLTAQEALRRSERRLQQMIDAVPVYILSFSAAGEPTYVNKRYQDYLGFSVPSFDSLKDQLHAIIHPEDFPEVHHTFSNCFQTGEPFLMRFRRRGKDGIYRWTEGRAEPLRDQDGTIVQWYAVSLDIEDEKLAQEALRQASVKLAQAAQAASLAELSASIAHEVNQPLAAIVANSHACQRWLSAEPPNLERAKITVERVIRDANSAADVVGRIRALFKQSSEPSSSKAALSSVITEVRGLMAEEASRRRVRMEIDVDGDLPLAAFDRVQVQQVLINLIRNGMEAMESAIGDRVLAMRAYRIGDLIQTEISDRGQGVKFPDKIFEPFFTTKESGMGMGLAICRSIIESHGGRLWAEKNEPHGATFVFTLPIEVETAP